MPPKTNRRPRPLRTKVLASRATKLPEFPEIASHERDAAAFWGRRIATSLAIGNGAGVVALSSFIASADNLERAAAFAFASFSYFLSGLTFAFLSFFMSLIYSAGRFDALADYLTKLEARVKVRKHKSSADFGEIWQQRPILYTITSIVILIQISAIAGSGIYFYLGSANIVTGLSRMACGATPSSDGCTKSPSFPFSWMQSVGESRAYVSIAGKSSSHGQPAEHWVDELQVTLRDPTLSISAIYFEQRFRLSMISDSGDFQACYLEVPRFFAGDELSYNRRQSSNRLIEFAARNDRLFDVRPAELLVTVILSKEGKTFDIQTLGVSSGPDGIITTGKGVKRPLALRSYTSRYNPGIFVSIASNTTEDCKQLVKAAGIEAI